jgi:hypothetical protein
MLDPERRSSRGPSSGGCRFCAIVVTQFVTHFDATSAPIRVSGKRWSSDPRSGLLGARVDRFRVRAESALSTGRNLRAAMFGTYGARPKGAETWAAELPKLSTFRPVQNSVYNAKRRMAYGPVRRLSSGCPEADRSPNAGGHDFWRSCGACFSTISDVHQRLSARRRASSSASRAPAGYPPCWEAANGQTPRWAHRFFRVSAARTTVAEGQTLMTAREVV